MSELPEWWTGPYPEVGSAQTAAAYIDALGGALARRQENGSWVLSTGTQDLLRADSESELDTFVLGFALAHLIVERHGLIWPFHGVPPQAATPATTTGPVSTEPGPPAAAPAAAPVATEPPGLTVVPDDDEGTPDADTDSSAAADRDAGDDSPDAGGESDEDDPGEAGGSGGGRRRGGRSRRR
jgi:hypothetical protein